MRIEPFIGVYIVVDIETDDIIRWFGKREWAEEFVRLNTH